MFKNKVLSHKGNIRNISFCLSFMNRNRLSSENESVSKNFKKDTERVQWRTPAHELPDAWYSKLKLFASEKDTNADFISMLQQPMDFSAKGIKDWWSKKNIRLEKSLQSFIPERNNILGNDLAAAHFIVHRGGQIKFTCSKNWIKKDAKGNYSLPNKYESNFLIEAISCDNMNLHYEGLENIRRLKSLKTLTFKNVKNIDNWCLDRISGSSFESLELLDLSGTKINEHGLCSLYRIPSLKKLILSDIKRSTQFELACAMLEEIIPNLKITE